MQSNCLGFAGPIALYCVSLGGTIPYGALRQSGRCGIGQMLLSLLPSTAA